MPRIATRRCRGWNERESNPLRVYNNLRARQERGYLLRSDEQEFVARGRRALRSMLIDMLPAA